jgi:hypothetical protein
MNTNNLTDYVLTLQRNAKELLMELVEKNTEFKIKITVIILLENSQMFYVGLPENNTDKMTSR